MSKSISKLLVALAVALFVPFASASTVTYTSSSAFGAATGINVVENYGTLTNGEDITSGSTVDGLTYSGFVLGDGATDLDISDLYHSISGEDLGADHTAADGPPVTYFLGGEGATITFAQPVTAFGMFFDMDLDAADSYGFTTSTGATASVGGGSYPNPNNTFVFAGLTSTTPFTSITFYSVGGDADYAVPEVEADLVTKSGNFATQAPEPASWELLVAGIGLVGAGLVGRRRRISRRLTQINADSDVI